jgi:hypothetical protein
MAALFFRERIDISVSVQSPRLLAGCLRPSKTVSAILHFLLASRLQPAQAYMLTSSPRRLSCRELPAGQRGRLADKHRYKATPGSSRFMAVRTDRTEYLNFGRSASH